MAGSILKILSIATFICAISIVAEAKSYQEMVQEIVHAQLNHHVFAPINQARFKRNVATKTLEDPQGCLDKCRQNETQDLVTAALKNTARILTAVSEAFAGGGNTNSPAFKKRLEEKTIASIGPLFEDMCKIFKGTGSCYSKCPDSQARTVLTIDNDGSAAAICEPSANWNSFPEYWAAINCTNNTQQANKSCKKCGPDPISLRNDTKLSIDNATFDEDGKQTSKGIKIRYETDAKKNTDIANRDCKVLTCQADCYKADITKNCGAKAYDLYVRTLKVDPRTTLGILKTLKAVNDPDQCKSWI